MTMLNMIVTITREIVSLPEYQLRHWSMSPFWLVGVVFDNISCTNWSTSSLTYGNFFYVVFEFISLYISTTSSRSSTTDKFLMILMVALLSRAIEPRTLYGSTILYCDNSHWRNNYLCVIVQCSGFFRPLLSSLCFNTVKRCAICRY